MMDFESETRVGWNKKDTALKWLNSAFVGLFILTCSYSFNWSKMHIHVSLFSLRPTEEVCLLKQGYTGRLICSVNQRPLVLKDIFISTTTWITDWILLAQEYCSALLEKR
jgi:hypothetical protein